MPPNQRLIVNGQKIHSKMLDDTKIKVKPLQMSSLVLSRPFLYSINQKITERFSLGAIISKSDGESIVRKCQSGKHQKAVKIMSVKQIKSFISEIITLKSCSYPFIVTGQEAI
jgi:hypothetical protein